MLLLSSSRTYGLSLKHSVVSLCDLTIGLISEHISGSRDSSWLHIVDSSRAIPPKALLVLFELLLDLSMLLNEH